MVDDIYPKMIEALEDRWPTKPYAYSNHPDWIKIEELRVGTGYGKDKEQRLDVFIISQGRGHERIALEVKISRSDFLREIKQPLKRRPGLRFGNRFYFYAPKGMIQPTEIPPECGLLEFDPTGSPYYSSHTPRLAETVVAPWRDVFPPSWSFLVSVYRNVQRKNELANERFRNNLLLETRKVVAEKEPHANS